MADKDIAVEQISATGKWSATILSPTTGKVVSFDAAKAPIMLMPWAVGADIGDADVTLSATSARVQLYLTNLGANRTVTLPSTGTYNGLMFRVVRTGLGAFTLDVGGLKTIPNNTAAFVDVAHDGTAWRLAGYGTL